MIVDVLDCAAVNYGKIVSNSQEALNYYFELDLETEKIENVICSKLSANKFKDVVTNIIVNETIKDNVVYFLPSSIKNNFILFPVWTGRVFLLRGAGPKSRNIQLHRGAHYIINLNYNG